VQEQQLRFAQQEQNVHQIMQSAGAYQTDLPNQSINPDLLTIALTKAQMEQELRELECKDYSSDESGKNSSKELSES